MKQGKVGICLIGAGRAGLINGYNYARNVEKAYLTAIFDANEQSAWHEMCKAGCRNWTKWPCK